MSDVTSYSGTLSTLNLENTFTGAMEGPSPIGTDWLATVERRIRESIAQDADKRSKDVRWLTIEAASSALRFFRLASDALPGEPYIYGTAEGEVVAEFKAKHGTLTSIVSGNTLRNYAVIDGTVQSEEPVDLATVNAGMLQAKLRPITQRLVTGKHGAAVGP